jgi:hypothetical protein
MINLLGCSAQGIAVTNDVTTVALLERMVERKILTRADVRAFLGNCIECLEPRINVRTVAGGPPDARSNATSIRRID